MQDRNLGGCRIREMRKSERGGEREESGGERQADRQRESGTERFL